MSSYGTTSIGRRSKSSHRRSPIPKSSKTLVETRDGEINRLSLMLEGGRPYDVVALESRNRSNERLISSLNIQIDYLQQRNQELQQQIEDAVAKAHLATTTTVDVESRNLELERELKDVDRMARQIELEKHSAVRTADLELDEAQMEVEKCRRELEKMDLDIIQLRAEKEQMEAEVAELRASLLCEKSDRQRLEDLLDKVQEDKKRLGQRVTKLTSNERDLVFELDRLKHKNGYVKKRNKSPDRIQMFIKGIEEERDYWKGEVEVLQKLLREKSRSPSPLRSRSPKRSKSPSRSLTSTPSKGRSRQTSPSRVSGKKEKEKKNDSHLEAIVRVLEDERDHYKRECEILRSLKHRAMSPTRSSLRDKGSDSSELARVQRERDELQSLLDKFERHMAEIQANVKVLTQERDKLSSMYEDTKTELDRVRRDVVRSPKSAKTSLAAQAVLRRVENERDDAIAELRRMGTERDSLRERLKIATDGHLSDRARLEQRIEDLESRLLLSEKDLTDGDAQAASLQRLVGSLEDRIREQALQLSQMKEEVAHQKSASTQMRLLAEQAERSMEDQQYQLTRKETDLRNAENQILNLEQKLAEVNATRQVERDELITLKSTISSLDREKDDLQAVVDDKAEKLAQLEEEIIIKNRMIAELQATTRDLELTIDRSKDNFSAKEHEVASLRRQLDATTEELTDTSRGREVALRENRRLQDDLATMTRENQNLNGELTEALQDKEQLKDQVLDYITEVRRIEELLSAKEQERSDLLEQYRSLSLETERYETHTHQLESEGSNLRLELMTRDSEIRRLREKIETLERDLNEHMHAQHSYEVQVSNMTKTVANFEESLRHEEDEKQGLLQDLAAVRDLCTKLEVTKDSLQRQLTARTLEQEKLQVMLDDKTHEVNMLRSQVSSERSNLASLEGLLQSNRETDFHIQLAEQEKNAEIQLLKDRLSLNENKLESQSRELTAVRTRNIELETEVERLRRQLTNERFERERAVQELRRHGLAPPGDGRLSRGSPAPRSNSPSRFDSFRSQSPDVASLRSRSKSPSRRRSSPMAEDDDPLTSLHTKTLHKTYHSLQKSRGKALQGKISGSLG